MPAGMCNKLSHVYVQVLTRYAIGVTQICRDWNETIRYDVGLVYKQELAIAGMEDGDADMDVAERLRLLRMHQDAWDKLQFTTDAIVYMNPESPYLSWELHDGILTHQTSLRSLSLYRIPSKLRGVPAASWSIDDTGVQLQNTPRT